MSGFGVKPAALSGYAKLLGGDAGSGSSLDREYLIDATQYVDKHVRLKGGQGGLIFVKLEDKVGTLCDQLVGNYSILNTTLSESAQGLQASAREYRSQDHANAEHVDKVYKPSGVPPLDDGVDVQAPRVDPRSKLTEPGTSGAVPNLVDHILGGAGYFSISGLVEKIIKLCGFDVQGWVKDRFVGDLSAAAKSKNALKNLADFDEVAAASVAEGCNTTLESWHRHAATGAHGYFDKLANAIEGESGELSHIAQQYDALVVSIQQGADMIMTLINDVIEAAVEAAAAVAAAGCVQEIPGVDVLADIIGGWRVWKVISAIHKVTGTWSNIWMGNQGMVAMITGLVGGIPAFDLSSKLPKMGYYNPSQGGPPDHSGGEHHYPGGMVAR